MKTFKVWMHAKFDHISWILNAGSSEYLLLFLLQLRNSDSFLCLLQSSDTTNDVIDVLGCLKIARKLSQYFIAIYKQALKAKIQFELRHLRISKKSSRCRQQINKGCIKSTLNGLSKALRPSKASKKMINWFYHSNRHQRALCSLQISEVWISFQLKIVFCIHP